MPRTLKPLCKNWRQIWEARKPLAPVTRIQEPAGMEVAGEDMVLQQNCVLVDLVCPMVTRGV